MHRDQMVCTDAPGWWPTMVSSTPRILLAHRSPRWLMASGSEAALELPQPGHSATMPAGHLPQP